MIQEWNNFTYQWDHMHASMVHLHFILISEKWIFSKIKLMSKSVISDKTSNVYAKMLRKFTSYFVVHHYILKI